MSTRSGRYTVGYGRPPEQTRFKKGQSGNPRGRPKKVRATAGSTEIERLFSESCGEVFLNGRSRHLSGEEAMYRSLIKSALAGDVKSAGALLEQRRRAMQALLQVKQSLRGSTAQHGGVMLVPSILPMDEWERQAVESQMKLIQDTQEDRWPDERKA